MSILFPDLPFTQFPTNIQTFVTMLNMTANDAPLIKQYQTAMENGDTALAQSIYIQIANADAKFIDSTKLNTLMQTCVALQRFYKTDIQPYITTKQGEWQGIVDEFSYQGIYAPSAQYEVNNFVLYNLNGVNFVYICTSRPPTSNIPPTNTTYWRQLTIQGVKGDSGIGLSFLYEWNSETNYGVQDLVSYDNKLWGCLVPNTNQVPYEGSTYWRIVGSVGQIIYPFQSNTPTGQAIGELWFQIV